MKRVICTCAAVLTLVVSFGFQNRYDAPPGGMKLLPGYQYLSGYGFDIAYGTIWKPGGVTIDYLFALTTKEELARRSKEEVYVWFKEQMVNEQPVQIGLTKEQNLIVRFPKRATTFTAKVKTEEDITDVLLMVLTYKTGN